MTLASVIPIVIGTVGIAALAFRARPLKVFLFNYKSGNSAFEIIGAGPDADRVEEFVSSVAAQIRKANGEV
jgi:hypothetical protein